MIFEHSLPSLLRMSEPQQTNKKARPRKIDTLREVEKKEKGRY